MSGAKSTSADNVAVEGALVFRPSTSETKQLALTWCVPEEVLLDARPVAVQINDVRLCMQQSDKDKSERLLSVTRTVNVMSEHAVELERKIKELNLKLQEVHNANVVATEACVNVLTEVRFNRRRLEEFTHMRIGAIESREQTAVSLLAAATGKLSKLEERLKALEARPSVPIASPVEPP